MARVIIWNLITLDGFFEGAEKWDLGFHQAAWSDDLAAIAQSFGQRAGLLVFGRITYEGMKGYWTAETGDETEVRDFMNALPKLVGSRTLVASDWNNTTMTADIVAEIGRRKAGTEKEKDIFIFGSAEVADALLAAGLVDEVMLALVPVSLGAGTPLFKRAFRFDLLEAKTIGRGVTLLRYAPAQEG